MFELRFFCVFLVLHKHLTWSLGIADPSSATIRWYILQGQCGRRTGVHVAFAGRNTSIQDPDIVTLLHCKALLCAQWPLGRAQPLFVNVPLRDLCPHQVRQAAEYPVVPLPPRQAWRWQCGRHLASRKNSRVIAASAATPAARRTGSLTLAMTGTRSGHASHAMEVAEPGRLGGSRLHYHVHCELVCSRITCNH